MQQADKCCFYDLQLFIVGSFTQYVNLHLHYVWVSSIL